MSLTVLQDESIGAEVVDDDDEIEGLTDSLKEMVQDQDVNPKLQCVIMDPSFSMVTVQSENSGIIWETTSSRCSSPWASEASTTSEAYSMEGSGPAGKVIFIMDEDKIVRKRKKTRGKLGERFKRPVSRPAPATELLGDERPAMVEVSVPNIRPQSTGENEEPASPKEDKEQDLFSIVSEGYEILNIIVPSRLPTVDEEETSEMAENLSYLEETKMIKSYSVSEESDTESSSTVVDMYGEAKAEGEDGEELVKPDISHSPLGSKPAGKDGTSDADYFEKFTLMDENTPADQPSRETEEDMLEKASEVAEMSENQEQSVSNDQEDFALSGDIEIASNRLDEVFYGSRCYNEPDDFPANRNLSEAEEELYAAEAEPSKCPLKESGSDLFGSEETVLTPIFLSPGPPKIIDPALLDEPRAMSFLYTDLYEEAVGDRMKGEDCSDVESTVSERSFQRKLSDADDQQWRKKKGRRWRKTLQSKRKVYPCPQMLSHNKDTTRHDKEACISEPPESYRDDSQDAGNAEALDYEMISRVEASEPSVAGTLPAKDDEAGEQPKCDSDFVEASSQDFPSGFEFGKLSRWISILQGRSEKIEDLVSELEQAYNSVEEKCKSDAQSLDDQNEEMVRALVNQFNKMSRSMGEKKKLRLEQLCGQIGTFQEHIESAKETLEMKAKEVEGPDQFALLSSSKDINKSLSKALESTLSLQPVVENYTRGTVGSEQKVLKDIPVPREPHLLAQEPSSATCTSVTIFWRVNEGDVINCFQVHCVEESQGEEHKVTVKESYCTLEELAPDRRYRVWVVALNYTGCSLPSEKLSFRTAPSVPVISLEQCTVCWDSATIRWSTGYPTTAETFTLEYCRQNASEGEGLRSISGIKNCEQSVPLQPNEKYLFYIKAVNFAADSEQSEATLISTTGTRFHLLKDTASPGLVLSKDNVVHYPEEAFNTAPNECQGILAELLSPRGHHYWETTVEGSQGYRIGVAYQMTPRDSRLGENRTSWCIHCVPTSTSCQYELLHDSTQAHIITAEVPTRIGVLLDSLRGHLSFFNAQSGQLLGSFCHKFTEPCYPALVLERPGTLALKPVTELPNFAKRC
ncbi:hypothetical protein AAFF_G00016400 [Aldrovandia affinis]|uniref:Cardiomyopathy-associated protein 5 n=1 Tax=Aldrovandia affinis TaxID=143900 RepID=A0AAD7S5Z4_9TELE|nr:hypothetical protein AAFF_G00016400 [Aldrovandia affinis]